VATCLGPFAAHGKPPFALRLALLWWHCCRSSLTEPQRRLWLGAEARELGSDGLRIVADAVRRRHTPFGAGGMSWMPPQSLAWSFSCAGQRRKRAEHRSSLVDALETGR
jgi:hypothetical protein